MFVELVSGGWSGQRGARELKTAGKHHSQGKKCRIRFRVCDEGHLEHERAQSRVKVEGLLEGVDDHGFGQVLSIVRQEVVVGHCQLISMSRNS